MKTGFIVLNHNSAELTGQLVSTVCQYPSLDYIIVIDNGSTDGSLESLKRLGSEKIIVEGPGKNGGYSFGNNYGAKIAKDLGIDIVFFANPDILVKEEDIEKILAAFEGSDHSLLTGIEYNRDGSLVRPVVCNINTYADDLAGCFFLGRKILAKNEIRPDKGVKIRDMTMFRGSFFAIRLKDFLEVGGFDDRVFLYCEERILSKRLWERGKTIGLVTGAVYIHDHSQSINKKFSERWLRMKMLYGSRLFYHSHYNNISRLKYAVLKAAMCFSLFEFYVTDRIKGLLNHE